MRRIIIAIIVIMIIFIGISIWAYLDMKENERIDAEAVTIIPNVTVEFGKEVKVSDFLQNLNGTLLDNHEIDTEHLGEEKVSFNYKNIKNKERNYTFSINVIDTIEPKILSGSSYTVEKGYKKKLEDVLLSGDDIDDTPKREVIGEYDFNTVGDYNLTYVVTDASNNTASKDFTLHVVEKITPAKTSTERTNIEDVIEKHKSSNTKIGIDVSKWQGEINWTKVKDSGIEFAIIRVGYQTEYDGEYKIDPYFEENIKGAILADIPVGIYFYSYAKTVAQAEEQAEWVIDKLENYKISLPIAFDWESWNSFNTTGMSFYTINKVANTFLEKLENKGYKGMLYGSKTYLTNIWYPSKYDIWLAHYTDKTNYEGNYTIWQMCENGKVDGIKENVDINVMYIF